MLQCEVIGNLGSDAEIKEFSGKKYVSFSVAHSEVSKDQQGNRVGQTTWVSVLWYGDGGGLFQYLKKGNKELLWCWSNGSIAERCLRFYDAKYKCTFRQDGHRSGWVPCNYAPYEGELPQWAKDALKKLED